MSDEKYGDRVPPPLEPNPATYDKMIYKFTKKKYGKLDSNQRPRGYEPRALPLRHPRKHVMLLPAVGFDPTTSPL
jgi:hypothetical protein